MKPIFVDTNAWIALSNKRDHLHKAAVTINRNLLQKEYYYITTNFVLDETYTGLLRKVGHFAAVDFGENVRRSKLVRVVFVTEEMELQSWKLFKKCSDKKFSFTDCTSFVVMRQLKLKEAFTSDHHFEQMGLEVLLRK